MGELKQFAKTQRGVIEQLQDASRQARWVGLALADTVRTRLANLDLQADAEELRAFALDVSVKARAGELDVRAEAAKLVAEAQRAYGALVVKGQQLAR